MTWKANLLFKQQQWTTKPHNTMMYNYEEQISMCNNNIKVHLNNSEYFCHYKFFSKQSYRHSHSYVTLHQCNEWQMCVCVSAHPQHLKLTSVSLNMTQMKQPPHRFLSHPDELQMFWEHLDLICGLMTSFIEFLKLSVFAWKQPVTYSDLLLGQIAFSVRYLIMFVIKHICSFRSLPTISGL